MKVSQEIYVYAYRYATDHYCPQGRFADTRCIICNPLRIPIFIISQDSLNMQDDRGEGYYRVRIIQVSQGWKSGNGINSGKLKMPEGRERGRGRSLEVIVQHVQLCIRTNCYEQIYTYASKPHRERKEENEVVVPSTRESASKFPQTLRLCI